MKTLSKENKYKYVGCESQCGLIPLNRRSFANESDVTHTNRRSLEDTPATPVSKAIPTTFGLKLRNGKSSDLHMFNGSIANGIVTVNS